MNEFAINPLVLGRKIKEVRLERGMTQAELCGDFLTRNMLSRIENGCALPSLQTLSYLAGRLDRTIGYFLDGEENQNSIKNFRLLNMIKEEYRKGNYALCLDYVSGLTDCEEEASFITAYCAYQLGKSELLAANLSEAKKNFRLAAVSSYGKSYSFPHYAECRMQEAVIDAFYRHSEAGEEGAVLRAALDYSDCRTDLILFAYIFVFLCDNGIDAAEKLLAMTRFSERSYALLAEGLIAFEKREYSEARLKFLETMGFPLPAPMTCHCLTLLEKSNAFLHDYEKAYTYAAQRRDFIKKMLGK